MAREPGRPGPRVPREPGSPALRVVREIAREVVRHVRRHDLLFYAAGLTFHVAIAVVPRLGIAAFAAALVPATSYGDGPCGRWCSWPVA